MMEKRVFCRVVNEAIQVVKAFSLLDDKRRAVADQFRPDINGCHDEMCVAPRKMLLAMAVGLRATPDAEFQQMYNDVPLQYVNKADQAKSLDRVSQWCLAHGVDIPPHNMCWVLKSTRPKMVRA